MNHTDISLEELYETYYGYIYTIIHNAIYDTNDTNEVLQDVFLQAVIQIEHLKKHENVRAWLATTAHYITKNYNRRYLKKKKYLDFHIGDIPLIQPILSESNIIENLRLQEMINSNIISSVFIQLSEEERQLYKMKFIKRLSLQDISLYYEISRLAVNTRIYRLKKKIKNLIYAYSN